MMKLIKIIAFSFLIMVSVTAESGAFLLPPGPVSPTVDTMTDVSFSQGSLATTAQTYAAEAMAYMNDMTKQAKALKNQYMEKFTGFVGGLGDKLKGIFNKEKQPIPGSKTIEKSKIADIYDAESVKKALYTLFLAYPMDCDKDAESFQNCKDYRAKAEEFYQDTVIEIYTAVRQMELAIPELEASIDKLPETFSGAGGDGAETAEDESGAWKNLFTAYETMDNILKLIEELDAMKAQYEAALFLREQVTPAAYVPEKDRKAAKTSAYMPEQKIQTASLEKYAHSETLVFGQMAMIAQDSSKNVSGQVSESAEIYDEDDEEYEYDPELYGKVQFVDALKPPLKSVFEGNREKLLELDKVAPLYDKSKEVKNVHNLLQALDSYREIFESYEKFKKLHQKSLQAVAAADQCAIQYLGRHYADPERVWKGSMADAAINDYDARQGISGWAVKAFEIAKSEESSLIDEEDFATVDMDMDIDINDSQSEDKIKADMEKKRQAGFTGLTDANKETEVEKASRESQMISFNIGAEAAKTLVEDQYKSAPTWGTPKAKFPVWNDQINFYTQYIDGKYANIKDYLHQLDVNAVIVDIAYKLNDILTTDDVERRNNRAGLDKLSARLGKENPVSDPVDVLKDMEKSRTQLLNQALQNKNKQLQVMESQKKTLQSTLSKASALHSEYSEQLNTASQNKLSAEIGIAVKEKQIGNLEERRGEDEDNLIRVSDVEYEEQTVEITPETTKTVQKTEMKETTEKKQLFDSQNAIAEYKDDIQKLQYQVKQQEVAKAVEEEAKTKLELQQQTPAEKKTLFRQRPFSDNSGYAPLNTLKYSLSQTLYFGAEYPSLNKNASVRTVSSAQNVQENARVQLIPVTANSNKDGSLSLHPESKASAQMSALSNSSANTGAISSETTQDINYFQEKAKLDRRLDLQISQQTEVKNVTSEVVSEEEVVDAVEQTYTKTIRSEKMEINKEDSADMALAKLELADNVQEVENKEKEALQLKTLVKAKEQESQNLTQRIDAVENKIKSVEADYTSQLQKIEQAYNQKLEEAQAYINDKRQARETLDLISYYQEKIGVATTAPFSLLNILRTATDLTDDTRSYADQLIDDANKSIMKLGDGVYVGEHGDKIKAIHIKLMDKLEALPIEGLSQFSSKIKAYDQNPSIMKPLSSLFQKILLQKACAGNNCKKVDSDYFVGLSAKERDFMAPKAAPKEYLPPLREVVYFDETDHENVKIATDGGVARDNFLNSGGKFPEIWKRILNGKAFVDKDVDLKTLLSEGNEAPAFMRGGRYPCRLDEQIIDIKDIDGQFTVYNSKALPKDATAEERAYRPSEMSSLPQCREISLESKGNGEKLYITVKDKVEEITAAAKVEPFQSFKKGAAHSELGTLLKFTDQGLFFNDAPAKAFEHLEKMTSQANNSNSSYTQNMQDIVYQKALLKNNQFGNFLTFVEQEISYRQALEELELRIAEAKETLFEEFDKMGFKPSLTYNLAQEDDYRLTKEVLTNRKNTLVNEAFADMEKIQVEDNEVVEERIKKIRHILTAARKDKNAYIPLSDVIDSGAELDESIKTEEVNHHVTDKYKKRADEEFEKQISSFPIPFCAAY